MDRPRKEEALLPDSHVCRKEEKLPRKLIEDDTLAICSLASAAASMILKHSRKKNRKQNCCWRRLICCLKIQLELNVDNLEEEDLVRLRSVSTDKESVLSNPLLIRDHEGVSGRKMSVSEASNVDRVVVLQTLENYCLQTILDELF